MPFKFEFDDREFGRAIDYVVKNTGRTAKEAINRAALTAIIGGKGVQGAMTLTPKAKREAIKLVPVASIAKFVMAREKGKRLTRAQINELIDREYKRRIKAIGYIAYVGWSYAAKAFGGRGVKGVGPSDKKLARFGRGIPATTETNPVAIIINTAPNAEKIGLEALQMGITNAARDLVAYTNRKIDQLFKSVNH